MSESHKGKKLTEEHKTKISKALKGKVSGANNGFYGHHRTKKEIENIIKSVKEKKSKQVCQLTLDGKLIAIWPSASEAARTLKLSQGNISAVCRGERNNCGGYGWMYKKDYDNMQ